MLGEQITVSQNRKRAGQDPVPEAGIEWLVIKAMTPTQQQNWHTQVTNFKNEDG